MHAAESSVHSPTTIRRHRRQFARSLVVNVHTTAVAVEKLVFGRPYIMSMLVNASRDVRFDGIHTSLAF